MQCWFDPRCISNYCYTYECSMQTLCCIKWAYDTGRCIVGIVSYAHSIRVVGGEALIHNNDSYYC